MTQFEDVTNHPAFAGGVGAFVSLILSRKMTWTQSVLAWLAGWACAVYLAPILMNWSALMASGGGGTSFLVGAFGFQVIGIFYDIFLVLRDDPRATLSMVIDILQRKGGAPK